MEFKAKDIAQLLQGTLEGNENISVNKLCKIEEGEKGGLSFLANMKYTPYIYTTNASLVIVSKDFVPEKPISTTLLRVENPYLAFAHLLSIYNEIQLNKVGVSTQAFIHPSAKIGENCYVGEFAYIGENVKIGDNSKIYPQTYIGDNTVIGNNTTLFAGVKVYSNNVIGNECIIHSGVVVGADGFGFASQNGDDGFNKVSQIGNVIIEDNVEIGANTCIDRATLGSTIIRKGVKIDNLCQVAHNVVIGENTAMAAQTGFAGSSKIGKNCIFAGQVGVVGHIEVGDKVIAGAQSGITRNVKSDTIVLGSPALEVNKMRKIYVYQRKLDEMEKRITELEKKTERK